MGVAAGDADVCDSLPVEVDIVSLGTIGVIRSGKNLRLIVVPVSRPVALGDAMAIAIVIVLLTRDRMDLVFAVEVEVVLTVKSEISSSIVSVGSARRIYA